MKLSATIFLVTLLFGSCNSYTPNSYSQADSPAFDQEETVPKTPEELRIELKAQEEMSPNDYISGDNIVLDPQQVQTRRAGLFRDAEYAPDGAILSGTFHNSATLARFKDVRIRLKYYSQTNTLIDEAGYIIYKYVEPQSSTRFSFKIPEVPEAMATFRAEIVGATAVSE